LDAARGAMEALILLRHLAAGNNFGVTAVTLKREAAAKRAGASAADRDRDG
jgi:hypothetical protein